MKKLSLFALFAVLTLTGCKYTPVKTFTEAEDPTPLSEEAKAAWGEVKAGLNGSFPADTLLIISHPPIK